MIVYSFSPVVVAELILGRWRSVAATVQPSASAQQGVSELYHLGLGNLKEYNVKIVTILYLPKNGKCLSD